MSGKSILGWALAAILVLVIGIVGWQVGWWFTQQNTNRQDKVTRSSFGYQETFREQVTKNIGDVNDITVQIAGTKGAQQKALEAQRFAVLTQLCDSANKVTNGLPIAQEAFVQANCDAGAVSPNSTYGGNN